jgi:UDP-N-acetylglucosamine acyltransferase
MSKIHSTAIVDPGVQLGDGVEVGPHCVVEADVQIGAGTVLREGVIVRRYTSLGAGNFLDAYAVLGGDPQDLKFDRGSRSFLRIGDGNIFREGVTISRATGEGCETRVGSNTYWMAGAHAGHNAVIEDRVILVNGSAVAGHATVGPRAILSSHVCVHQFCWVGELAMGQGNSATTCHIPPFTVFADVNRMVGLNVVGLRRAPDITEEDRRQIREAFRLTYRAGLPRDQALQRMDACTDWGAPAGKFREFVRRVFAAQRPHRRPLCAMRARRNNAEE